MNLTNGNQSEKKINFLKKKPEINQKIYNSFDKFLSLYLRNEDSLKDIFFHCKKGTLPEEYRSYIWQIFLNILPYNESKEWKNIIDDFRSNYYNYKSTYINENIKKFILCNEEKGSEKYEKAKKDISQQDLEILSLIKLDIKRTYQEIKLFHNESIKENLCNVLYIFSKKNPNPGYFQGMSDICAIMLYVLYKEYTINSDIINGDICFLFYILCSDNQFIEADLYSLFSRLMSKDLYLFFNYNGKSFLSNKNLKEKLELTYGDIISCHDSILKKRVFNIFYIELKKLDESLSKILIKEEELDYFISRWYLCLFKNNISKTHLNFLDFIALSMFINVKNRMKKEDEEKHNLYVMTHYPEGLNVIRIIYDAVIISKKYNNNLLQA